MSDSLNQLEIIDGILLGSHHNFPQTFFIGDHKSFRGCLDEIYFNGKNLLELSVKRQQSNSIVHDVTIGEKCSMEFSISNETILSSITFIESNSFVLMPGLSHFLQENYNELSRSPAALTSTSLPLSFSASSQTFGSKSSTSLLSIEFDMKTNSINAILLFVPGIDPYRKNYLALELIRKRVKFSLSRKNDRTRANHERSVVSSKTIDDNHWHHIEISLSDIDENNLSQMMITVDEQKVVENFDWNDDLVNQISAKSGFVSVFGSNFNSDNVIGDGEHSESLRSFIERSLSDRELFIGGINNERQSLAINYGLESSMIEQNVSLRGCIRNFQINSRPINILSDALITQHIRFGKCRWHFLCFDPNRTPCIERSACIHSEMNQIRCRCVRHYHNQQLSDCVRKNFKHKTIQIQSEIIEGSVGSDVCDNNLQSSTYNQLDSRNIHHYHHHLDNNRFHHHNQIGSEQKDNEKQIIEIDVFEQSSVVLNAKLREVFEQVLSYRSDDENDLHMLNDNRTQIKLIVIQKPMYGTIDVPEEFDRKWLENNQLRYLNTISEPNIKQDTIKLMIMTTITTTKRRKINQIESIDYNFDSFCKTRSNFIELQIQFRIKSALINDGVQTQMHFHLKILHNSSLILNANLFKLDQQKDFVQTKNQIKSNQKFNFDEQQQQQLNFKIVKIDGPSNQSFFERTDQPSIKLNAFSEALLRNNTIRFVHKPSASYNEQKSYNEIIDVIFEVSGSFQPQESPRKFSKEFRLTIKTYSIDLDRLINTGLLMAHQTFSLITSANLSLVAENEIEKDRIQLIRYELIEEPLYGVIQKLRLLPNNWINVTQFNQRQIDRSKIRYLHLSSDPESEQLSIRIMFLKQSMKIINFPVKFIKHLELISYGSNGYNLSKDEKEFFLTTQEMLFRTRPILMDSRTIMITLKSLPSFGQLLLFNKETLQQKRMSIGSSFTMNDIEERRLLYLRNNSFINIDSIRDLIDSFKYIVSINKTDGDGRSGGGRVNNKNSTF